MKFSGLFLLALAGVSQAAVVQRDIFTADTASSITQSGDLLYVPGVPTVYLTVTKTLSAETVTVALETATVTVTAEATPTTKVNKRETFSAETATKTWKDGDLNYVPGLVRTTTIVQTVTVSGVVKIISQVATVTAAA